MIPRWEVDGYVDGWVEDPDGEWVKYSDHLASVSELRRLADDWDPAMKQSYEQGVSDERQRIRDGLMAIRAQDRHREIRWLLDEFAVKRIIDAGDK